MSRLFHLLFDNSLYFILAMVIVGTISYDLRMHDTNILNDAILLKRSDLCDQIQLSWMKYKCMERFHPLEEIIDLKSQSKLDYNLFLALNTFLLITFSLLFKFFKKLYCHIDFSKLKSIRSLDRFLEFYSQGEFNTFGAHAKNLIISIVVMSIGTSLLSIYVIWSFSR